MYARVAKWEGAEADAIRAAAEGIKADAASGPPEGLPAKALLLLIDPDGGQSMAISLYVTEEDRRQGDETLNAMSPPGDGMGQRSSVEMYEVAADLRM
jgi:hypothetical protein